MDKKDEEDALRRWYYVNHYVNRVVTFACKDNLSLQRGKPVGDVEPFRWGKSVGALSRAGQARSGR